MKSIRFVKKNTPDPLDLLAFERAVIAGDPDAAARFTALSVPARKAVARKRKKPDLAGIGARLQDHLKSGPPVPSRREALYRLHAGLGALATEHGVSPAEVESALDKSTVDAWLAPFGKGEVDPDLAYYLYPWDAKSERARYYQGDDADDDTWPGAFYYSVDAGSPWEHDMAGLSPADHAAHRAEHRKEIAALVRLVQGAKNEEERRALQALLQQVSRHYQDHLAAR